MTPIETTLLGFLFIAICAWQFVTIALVNDAQDSAGVIVVFIINTFISSALISYHILGWLLEMSK